MPQHKTVPDPTRAKRYRLRALLVIALLLFLRITWVGWPQILASMRVQSVGATLKELVRFTQPHGALELRLGQAYAERYNFVKAGDWFLRSAELGNAQGALAYGSALEDGEGVRQDDSEAFHWYQKAAKAQTGEGLFRVGRMLAEGRGVGQDMARAIEVWQNGLGKNNAGCAWALARAYERGIGVAKDMGKAAELYRQSAEGSDWHGMLGWGRFLWDGSGGVTSDPQAAYRWFEKAAVGRDPQALYWFALARAGGLGGRDETTTARSDMTSASNMSYWPARYQLGRFWLNGVGGPASTAQGLSYVKQAADAGYAPAERFYGEFIYRQNAVVAQMWLQRAQTHAADEATSWSSDES